MYKKRILLKFPPDVSGKPLTYQLIKNYDIVVNILQARIFPEEEGQLIIELQNKKNEHIIEGIAFLEKEGVEVTILEETIGFDREKCMDCGACTGVCKPGALIMDPDSWQLQVNQDKCVLCEMCISVCPVNALSLRY